MNLDDVLAELKSLNQLVPIPRRLPTTEEVNCVERRLGVRFHPDYRKYLLEASNVVYGTTEPNVVVPSGTHMDLIKHAEAAWDDPRLSKDLVSICYDNGDHFCINVKGEIEFWPHDGTSDEKWADLATWIKRVWIEGG